MTAKMAKHSMAKSSATKPSAAKSSMASSRMAKRFQKPVSCLMSVLLATMMLPAIPYGADGVIRAHAAEELITTAGYDAHPAPDNTDANKLVQGDVAAALFANSGIKGQLSEAACPTPDTDSSLKDAVEKKLEDVTVSKDDIPESVLDDLENEIKQDIDYSANGYSNLKITPKDVKASEDDPIAVCDTSDSHSKGQWTSIKEVGAPTIKDGSSLTDPQASDDKWTFDIASDGTSTVGANVSKMSYDYTFAYKCNYVIEYEYSYDKPVSSGAASASDEGIPEGEIIERVTAEKTYGADTDSDESADDASDEPGDSQDNSSNKHFKAPWKHDAPKTETVTVGSDDNDPCKKEITNVAGGTMEVQGMEADTDIDVSYDVNVKPLWNDALLKSKLDGVLSVKSIEYSKTGTAKIDMGAPLPGALAGTVDVSGSEEFFDAKVEAANNGQEYVVSVVAKRVFSEKPKEFAITWTYPDGTPVEYTTKVNVGQITPMHISFKNLTGSASLAYRLHDAQMEVIEQELQKQFVDAIPKGDDEFVTLTISDLHAGKSYPKGEAGASGVNVAFVPELSGEKEIDFVIDTDSVMIDVKDVPTTDSSQIVDFSLQNEEGKTPDQWNNGWSQSVVYATYAGHGLSYFIGQDYTEEGGSLELNSAEGTYSNQSLYAIGADNTITKVTGISYKLDMTAPVVASFDPGKPVEKHEGTWFFDSSRKVCNASAVILDEEGEEMATAEDSTAGGTAQAAVSGLDANTASLKWHDSKSNTDKTDADFFLDEESPDRGVFQFEIDGDQDVATDQIWASIKDNAGNQMDSDMSSAKQIPDDVWNIVTDSAKPVLVVSFDNNNKRNGKFYNANRTMTVTIMEANFEYSRQYDPQQDIVKITENGELRTFKPGAFVNQGGDVWTAKYTFSNNADYTVEAKFRDVIDRAADNRYQETFTIDKINPKLSVKFDNDSVRNGKYYNQSRTAVVTVVEHNFNENKMPLKVDSLPGNDGKSGNPKVESWKQEGDTHTATVTFADDGVYRLGIGGADLAENPLQSYDSGEFVVDTTKPEIDLAAVKGIGATAGEAKPGVVVNDTNIDKATSVQINAIGCGESWNFPSNTYKEHRQESDTKIQVDYGDAPRTPAADGVYSINVMASDLAGNTDSASESWSVNRFGSTYRFSSGTKAMLDNYYNRASDVSDLVITEVNPSKHGISDKSSMVHLVHDGTSTELKAGEDYSLETNNERWSTYKYTIPARNYAADGTYTLLLHSTDDAGNMTSNNASGTSQDRAGNAGIAFAIDNTAPICSYLNLASGFTKDVNQADNTYSAKLSVDDNIKLNHDRMVVVTVRNGDEETTTEYTEGDLQDGSIEISLPNSDSKQSISMVAYDQAGNQSDKVVADNILITSNPIVLWLNNLPLIIGTILALAAIAGAVVGVVWYRKRRNS